MNELGFNRSFETICSGQQKNVPRFFALITAALKKNPSKLFALFGFCSPALCLRGHLFDQANPQKTPKKLSFHFSEGPCQIEKLAIWLTLIWGHPQVSQLFFAPKTPKFNLHASKARCQGNIC